MAANESMARPKCNFMAVAKEYIEKRYPSFDAAGLKLLVSENENQWELRYELPAGMLGGAPVIVIDKKTCRVVHSSHEQ